MTSQAAAIARVQKALTAIRAGKLVILTDDEDRENEGDLVMAAEKVTAKAINFMAKEARGLICLSLTEERVRQLNLPLMVTDNTSPFQTAFTVSIEAATGVSTGISAADRAHTVKAAIAHGAKPSDVSRPGHIFPLRARNGGVLVRPGQTEGSVDLARLAGLSPSGVICEIMNDDGSMARRPDLEKFSKKHGLVLLSVADLITYRLSHERLVRRASERSVEVPGLGSVTAYAYSTDVDPIVHLALVVGDVSGKAPVLTRIHRSAMLGDVLHACIGGGGLPAAYQHIAAAGRGVLVLLQKHVTADDALSLTPASNERAVPGHSGQTRLKDLGVGAQILKDLGVNRISLLTNTPNTIVGAQAYGIEVVEQRALTTPRAAMVKPKRANAKRERLS